MIIRISAAAILLCAAAAGSADAQTLPVLTVPTMFIVTPYMDGQIGDMSSKGAQQRAIAPDGYTSNARSTAVIYPIGDGTVVKVEVMLNIFTDNIVPPFAANSRYANMLVAGLPPLDPALGARSTMFGFAGNFEGLQTTPGSMPTNFSLDGTQSLNALDGSGSRWSVVISFSGTDAPPNNCYWYQDFTGTFPVTCWLAGKNPDGKTHFRIRGGLWYYTTWAAVSPWLQSQEAAYCGKLKCVSQMNPLPH